MSAFGERVKQNVKIKDGKPPVITAKTSYSDDDVKSAGSEDALCDESSQVCLLACNYAVASIPSKVIEQAGVRYVVSSSLDLSNVVKPPKNDAES